MPVWQNLKRCVLIGIASATLYIAWVLVVYALNGSAAFNRLGVTLGAVIAFYLGGGIVGGAIVGLLWPLARWRAGAYLTSLVATAVLAFGCMVTLYGTPAEWDPRILWIAYPAAVLIFGIAFGGPLWRAVCKQSSTVQQLSSKTDSGEVGGVVNRTGRRHSSKGPTRRGRKR